MSELDSLADELFALLSERALSWGLVDIAVETDTPHLDVELTFSNGPSMGLTLDVSTGVCAYCELLDGGSETWLAHRVHIDPERLTTESERAAAVHEVMQGVLDARRPLLRRESPPS